MIILNWNIRGLGDIDKRARVWDFIYLFGLMWWLYKKLNFALPTPIFSDLLGTPELMNEWSYILLVLRGTTYRMECQDL